jgi:hypothetical protein
VSQVCPVCHQEVLETQVGAHWWTACRCADRVDPLPGKTATYEDAEAIADGLDMVLPTGKQFVLTTEVKHSPERQAEIDRNVKAWHQPRRGLVHHVDYVDYSVIDPDAPRLRIDPALARELVAGFERMMEARFPPPVHDPTPAPTLDPPAIDGRPRLPIVHARWPPGHRNAF